MKPIGKLFSEIYRQNQKTLAKELAPYNLGSGGQYGFLKLILEKPGITQEQMTLEMKFDKATTTRSVKHLEDSGYIERKTDPNDRRSFLIYPTSKALEFAPTLKSILAKVNSKFIAGFTEEEVKQLVQLLSKVSKNVAEN